MSANARDTETVEVAFSLVETRQILAVCQCLEQPLQVSLSKLCEVGGYASIASANAMWYKLRTKLGLIVKREDGGAATITPVKATRGRAKKDGSPTTRTKTKGKINIKTEQEAKSKAQGPKKNKSPLRIANKDTLRDSPDDVALGMSDESDSAKGPSDALLEIAARFSDLDSDAGGSKKRKSTRAKPSNKATSSKPDAAKAKPKASTAAKANTKSKISPAQFQSKKRGRSPTEDEDTVVAAADSTVPPVKHIDASLLYYIEDTVGTRGESPETPPLTNPARSLASTTVQLLPKKLKVSSFEVEDVEDDVQDDSDDGEESPLSVAGSGDGE